MFVLAVSISARAQGTSYIKEVAFEEALKLDVNPYLVLAIIQVESGFDPYAVGSSHNERGLMQLHPRYFPAATFDVRDNIRRGVRYLKYVKQKCLADYGDAWFICYNHGPFRRVSEPTLFPYYRKVKRVLAGVES